MFLCSVLELGEVILVNLMINIKPCFCVLFLELEEVILVNLRRVID